MWSEGGGAPRNTAKTASDNFFWLIANREDDKLDRRPNAGPPGIYSRLAGYEDTNDAERFSVDPVMRQVVGGWAVERRAAGRDPCTKALVLLAQEVMRRRSVHHRQKSLLRRQIGQGVSS